MLFGDANKRGITSCTFVEKSGQTELDFENGEDFGRRMNDASPTFAKAVVRYNSGGAPKAKENQQRRLKVLSDYAHSNGYNLMFEVLAPATESQLESVGQDRHAGD